jgi:hypothetical protein
MDPSVFLSFWKKKDLNRSTTFQKFATFGKFFTKAEIAELEIKILIIH